MELMNLILRMNQVSLATARKEGNTNGAVAFVSRKLTEYVGCPYLRSSGTGYVCAARIIPREIGFAFVDWRCAMPERWRSCPESPASKDPVLTVDDA
jgi:hypothetical protein